MKKQNIKTSWEIGLKLLPWKALANKKVCSLDLKEVWVGDGYVVCNNWMLLLHVRFWLKWLKTALYLLITQQQIKNVFCPKTIQCFKSQQQDFEIYYMTDRKPVESSDKWSDMIYFFSSWAKKVHNPCRAQHITLPDQRAPSYGRGRYRLASLIG